MKTMTCKQLGGACDKKFRAKTFDEIANLAKMHGTEMFQNGDLAHINEMQKMMGLMNDPKAMDDWMKGKQKEFDALPDSK